VTRNAMGQGIPSLNATQANQVETASQRRMLDIVRNIANNFVKPILRKWLAYDAEFLSPQEFIYITGKEPLLIDKKDLLQTSQQAQDPQITKMLYVKLLKLNKMFEEAKALESYQPQPDPMQQQMQKLQMAQAEADVQATKVKAMQNEADIQLKLAKAKDAGSKADINNLNYVQSATGQDHANELDKIGATALAKENMTSSSQ